MPRVFKAKNGKSFQLSQDEAQVKTVVAALRENDGYCPCRVDKDETTHCPCLPFRNGEGCICGLYEEVADHE